MGYIKQITIQGFKSYRDQTQIEPFSPKSNVIVGRNGSGKSNFFAAVRFVLGDAYTQMGREERQALLHEGAGAAVMSAYVEIVFDNSDGRYQNQKPELILRRTIGAKKDEYSIDRKNATKSDVQNLLEAAGFSKSNPYYIVPQGRVTHLTNMKDVERLNVLKEISGTQVYENRRADSLKLLMDTDNKRAKIDELVRSIQERLDELEEEKDQLEAYNDKDRERRCLLYAMHKREENRYTDKLNQIEDLKARGANQNEDNDNMFREVERDIQQIESEEDQLRAQINLLRDERRQLEDDRKETSRNKAQIELELNSLTDGQSAAQATKARQKQNLKNVQQQIQVREQELQQLLPEYITKKEEESNLRSQLLEAEGQRKRLEDKQGRTAFYSTKKQRDDALRKDIEQISVDMAQRKAVLMETNEEISELQKDIGRLDQEISELTSTIENRGDNAMSFAAKVQEAKDKRDALMDQHKESWREEQNARHKFEKVEGDLNRAERILSTMMDHNTSRGLESVRRLKRQHNLDGVYGTIAELLEVSDDYKIPTEITAGNSLFHLVVDNEETATTIVKFLNKERGGRVTCIPLNRVKAKPVQVPKSADSYPLLSKIRYDPEYENAFQHIFGKAVLCPNLNIATEIARKHGVDALTIDGDRAQRKGNLFGGYFDPSKSRLDAVERVTRLRQEVETLREQRQQFNRQGEQFNQQITQAVSEVRKLEHDQNRDGRSYGPLMQDRRSKQGDSQDKKDKLEAKQRSATNLESLINQLSSQQEDLEAELASDFKKALSTDEERQLSTLAVAVQNLRRQQFTLTASRSDLESRKAEIEVELRENLRPQLDQLLSLDIETSGGSNADVRLKECQRSLKRITRTLETLDENIRSADNQIDTTNTQLAQLGFSKAEKQQQNAELARMIEKYKKRMEKSMQDKSMYQEKLEDVKRSIRDLGSLPEDAWRKFERLDEDKAAARLRKVNESLKKYSHVNKKAFEQYENFTKQRKLLTDRRSDLDASRKSIENLIQVLDQRKDEAIDRTFKQVSKAFAEVFIQLVPAGIGRLIIQRKSDKEARRAKKAAAAAGEEESSDDDGEPDVPGIAAKRKSNVENYTGVGISVSFNSKDDEQQRIQQLSGGQKSLCALALVFAIQQCDPAPFYLFDEIDANLDAQYRTAVAAMLEKLSGMGGEEGKGGGQFICTTFRPEMVLKAEKCYGVTYERKCSSIDVVGREVALDFVEGMKQ